VVMGAGDFLEMGEVLVACLLAEACTTCNLEPHLGFSKSAAHSRK
jgi:hypothetical protein